MKKRVTINTNFFIILIVAFLLCVIIIKILYITLSPKVNGIDLKQFAENRNTKTKTLYASRGTIYDSSSEALAISVNSYTLIAYLSPSRTTDSNNPNHVVDKENTAKMLATVIDLDYNKILEYLNKDAYQVEFGLAGKNLTESEKKKIDDLELPGIDFIEGTQRYYKMGNFASYIIGYAKENADGQLVGELGLESYYNEELSGTDGYKMYQTDAYGYALPNKISYTYEAQSGSNIYLTLDSNIQIKAENAINTLKENYTFDWAIVSLLDAKTGAIVASATSPSFNPNDLNTLESYINPLVSYTYEPGSTMKTFAWAAAIEDGTYEGSKLYKSGSIKVTDVTISDFNKVGWGNISYDTGYAYSSNVAATYLSLDLGVKKLRYYYDLFGFGKTTGIELSGELKGDISFTYQSELATASFGQGITVTPIQMLQAYSAFANDGYMLKPYIVSKIVSDDGTITYENNGGNKTKVMEKETAEKMRELMYNVNYNGLTKSFQPKNVNLILKTGTAQIASTSGGYMDGKYDVIYSAAGLFPDDNPRYVVYAAVKRLVGPQKAFANMLTTFVDDVATYSKITTKDDSSSKENIISLKNYQSYDANELYEKYKDNLNVVLIGNGNYVTRTYPENMNVNKNSKFFVVTNGSEITMTDLTGWSLNDVKTYASLCNLKLNYTGYGYVQSQSIAIGESINENSELNVVLSK